MKYFKFIIFFVIFFIIFLGNICVAKTLENVIYKEFFKNDGLPSNHINCTLQDDNGFIWIASQGGVSRYDGNLFVTFNVNNTPEITVNDVLYLFQDSSRKIWIATANEILTFKKGKFNKILSTKNINGNVKFISEDQNNNICLIFDYKIYVYKNKKLLDFSNNFPKNAIFYSFYNSKLNKKIFFCSSKGLIITNDDYGFLYNLNKNLCIYKIVYWKSSLICATDDGLYEIFQKERKWELKKLEKIPNENFFSLHVDKKNKLLAISKKKVLVIDNYAITDFSIKYLEIPNTINMDLTGINVDNENNIWLTTKKGLLLYMTTTFMHVNEFKNKVINTVSVGNSGKIAVGTYDSGCYVKESFDFESYYLKDKKIRLTFVDSKNKVWVSTNSNLYKITNRRVEEIFGTDGKQLENIKSLIEDNDGKIWFQQNDTIAYYVNEKVLDLSNLVSFDNLNIRSMVVSKSGAMYFGTNKGLYFLKGKIFYKIRDKRIFDNPFIFNLFEDNFGTLWIGTDEGLFSYKNNGFGKITIKNGLKKNWISSIFEDSDNNLWLGNEGVAVANRFQLEKIINGEANIINFTYFSKEDGLPSNELSAGYQYCAFQDKKGFIWYCTMKGLAKVNPLNVQKNSVTPNAIIDSVLIDDFEQDQYKPIFIFPNNKRIDFDYTAPTFINNKEIRFKTRLIGYDDVWKIRKERNVSYTNLSPGDYSFEVKASNSDGVWSDKIANLKFTVIRPFYMTWWFYLISIILAFIILNLLVKFIKFIIQSAIFMQKSKYVGPYKLLEIIGSGGMGTVYKAISLETKDFVALKILNELITDEELKKRFIREGIICEEIKHPNIVKIFGRGEHRDRLYYAMEYCDGHTLREIMAVGHLPVLKCLWVTSVLIDVLHDLHLKGIVHRDIKPENIMLTNKFNLSSSKIDNKLLPNLKSSLKLLDFGLAKTVGNSALTKTGLLAGTVYYLPPECLKERKDWYPEVDFYSAGVLLYEMLTGVKPFEGKDLMEVMYKILEYTPVSPKNIHVSVPRSISEFTDNLIQKDTYLRLSNYKDIRKQLDDLIKQVVGSI